ncbi:uncharacterized protein BDZ83DRAFT_798362 [Colletotrichum acutatum]|uniref:Uncharacterized protein n=1 Tax=Glomerella acutata TaxID=27357 RepID=A0AAD8U8L5_GLOAC|nr:uncharacterized protein BDZ83DRAFT_798362 [Colletotrichum acutatum]KAK1700801.1 hypothetical protein BDZ83DRAFT_798362 [Colletotrichum acutatum]
MRYFGACYYIKISRYSIILIATLEPNPVPFLIAALRATTLPRLQFRSPGV